MLGSPRDGELQEMRQLQQVKFRFADDQQPLDIWDQVEGVRSFVFVRLSFPQEERQL